MLRQWLSRNEKKLIYLLVIYWVLIFVGTHMPLDELPVEMEPGVDKIIHFLLYFPLAFLLAAQRQIQTRAQWVSALGILLAYAAFDEISQIPVNRSAEFLDWVLDSIGSVAGLYAYRKVT